MIGNPMGNVLGNPLGNPLGLAVSSGAKPINPRTIYIPGSFAALTEGIYEIPSGTSFARVTAIGGGGNGYGSYGGAGGGLSRSPVLSVGTGEKITYKIPVQPARATDQSMVKPGAAATATLKNYSLLASGGGAGPNALGGVGSGGEVNSKGGNAGQQASGYSGGGGCAGIKDSGGDGSYIAGQSTYYAGDGGGGGATCDSNQFAGGGGGFGMPGGDASPGQSGRTFSAFPGDLNKPTKGYSISTNPYSGGDGGQFGGGAGSGVGAQNLGGLGGVGGFIIELW